LLGPSVLFASPPFCAAYAFHAWRGPTTKYAALAGLILSGVELLILINLMMVMMVGLIASSAGY